MGLYRTCSGGNRGRRDATPRTGSGVASCASITRRLHAACGALFALYLTASWVWAPDGPALLSSEPVLPVTIVGVMGLLAAATACAHCDPAGLFAGLLRALSGITSALLAARAISTIDRDTTGSARGRLLVTFCLALCMSISTIAAAVAPCFDKAIVVKGD